MYTKLLVLAVWLVLMAHIGVMANPQGGESSAGAGSGNGSGVVFGFGADAGGG